MRPVWFESLFGFEESSYAATQRCFSTEDEYSEGDLQRGAALLCVVNGRRWGIGTFSTPSLRRLREQAAGRMPGRLRITHEVIADVLPLHSQADNSDALFQVASQFNCLEFPGPSSTPEDGVSLYALDNTQGPACSLAAAAASVYRNYLLPMGGTRGQTRDRQLNNLDDLSAVLGEPATYFEVRNGYVNSTSTKLELLAAALARTDRELLIGQIKIGLHQGVQVTFVDRFVEAVEKRFVSQAFCAAIPCGYSSLPLQSWEPLATLVLDAAYEATLLAGVFDAVQSNGSGKIWLTLLGRGAFGNRPEWIMRAMARAMRKCSDFNLDVRIAHFRRLDSDLVRGLEESLRT